VVDGNGNVIPAWKVFWTVFGSSNQLLAAMVLLALSVWMFKKKMSFLVSLFPSLFMLIVAVFSLYFILNPWIALMIKENKFIASPMEITAGILLILSVFLVVESTGVFVKRKK
jgi:carbon starvation protein